MIYLLEKKGKRSAALDLLEKLHLEGVPHPFYEEVKIRLKG